MDSDILLGYTDLGHQNVSNLRVRFAYTEDTFATLRVRSWDEADANEPAMTDDQIIAALLG